MINHWWDFVFSFTLFSVLFLGIQMLDSHVNDLAKAKSPGFNQQHTDICRASRGPEDNGRIVKGPSTLPYEASLRAVSRVLCISGALLLPSIPLNVKQGGGSKSRK